MFWQIVSWVWGTSIYSRTPLWVSSLSTRKLSYQRRRQLRRYKRFGVLGLLFVLPNYISRGGRESGKNNSVRAAHLLVTGWQSVGCWPAWPHSNWPRAEKVLVLIFFFHSFSVARAISLRTLSPARSQPLAFCTLPPRLLVAAGEIFSGYVLLISGFSLTRAIQPFMAKTHSMKFVSCCYFGHDNDFSIDFLSAETEPSY